MGEGAVGGERGKGGMGKRANREKGERGHRERGQDPLPDLEAFRVESVRKPRV